MTDPTPLEVLDDAVRAFAEAMNNLDEGPNGTVGGWVLAWETSAITGEPGMLPLIHSASYTTGPATSPATADGLASALARICRGTTIESMVGPADDDD